METLGLKLIPSLKDYDLFVEGERLDQLEQEARSIVKNMNLITQETQADGETLTVRVQNILDAVSKAREVSGGVYMG